MPVIKTKPRPPLTWCSERIAFAMQRRGMFSGYMLEEIDIAGHREDIVYVSTANYLTVCEVKVTLADWKADFKKTKWKKGFSPYIKNFFFVVPEHLIEKMPDETPDHIGIIGIKSYNGNDWPYVYRPAKAFKNAEKVTQKMLNRWFYNYYYRHRDALLLRRHSKFANKDV